jgi:hypothetical protein
MSDPLRYFNSSPELVRLMVMMYVREPLSLRYVEDLLAERGIDISHETIRFWWIRFGPFPSTSGGHCASASYAPERWRTLSSSSAAFSRLRNVNN